MPILKSPKHEMVARGLADGMTQVQAHASAGYTIEPDRKTAKAHTVANREDVKARTQELIEEKELQRKGQFKIDPDARTIEETGMSEVWIIQNLIKVVYACQAAGNFKTAIEAIEVVNRYLGYFNVSSDGEKGTHKKLEKGPESLKILISAVSEMDAKVIGDSAKDITPKTTPYERRKQRQEDAQS